ncbi:MAG: hypothetical protein D6731_08060 [Planctomycetota bacterium]|nr:MAG: hypothetical protein D6731_08060 [Planctomycetota bacterium]
MWDYKVVAGTYSLDGGDVVVENQLGRGTLQRILDHYGGEGFDLVSTHYDSINREIVLLLKKPRGGVVAPVAVPAAVPGAMPVPAVEEAPPRRRAAAARSGGRRRRSKEELDRLYREG